MSPLPDPYGSLFIWGVLWVFSVVCVLPGSIEEQEFMSDTTAHQQGMIKMFGFTFGELSIHPWHTFSAL